MLFGGNKERVVAVVDVGSGSAGFAIIAARKGGTRILAASRSILSLESRTPDQVMAGVVRMVSEAGTEVLKTYAEGEDVKKYGHPTEVYAIMRTPWARAFTRVASRSFEKELTVSRDTITEVAQEAYATEKDFDRDHLLETAVVRVELNGYPTSTPVGKRAKQIDVTTFMSDCDATMHEGVRAALETLLPGRPISIRSSARSYLVVVEELIQRAETYVIFDMVSEATSVMAIREGIITHHGIIDEGVRTIIRRIAGARGTPEETIGLMRMVVAGSCSGDECDKFNEALARVEPEIVRTVGESIAKIMGKKRLPQILVLFAHPDIAPWLAHLFSRLDFGQFTIPLQPFDVKLVSPDKLKSVLNIESDAQTDTGILVASAFVNMQMTLR